MYLYAKARTWMFRAVLFTVRQEVEATQRFISRWTDQQNVVCPHSGILFSQKKGWSPDRCSVPWMNLEHIVPSQRREWQKTTYFVGFHSYEKSKMGKSIKTGSQFLVARRVERMRNGSTSGVRSFFGGCWKCSTIYCVIVGCSTLGMYSTNNCSLWLF